MFISLTTVNRINVDVRLYENVGVKYSNDNDNASKMISEVNNGFYCNCNDNNGYYHSTTPTPALFTPIASKLNGIDQKIYKNIILEYIFGIALYENNNGNEVCDSTLNHFSLCLFELARSDKRTRRRTNRFVFFWCSIFYPCANDVLCFVVPCFRI